jgi:hypothetical protein
LLGWLNAGVPGAGYMATGEVGKGLFQLGYETGSFVGGLELSNGSAFSLDGLVSSTPPRGTGARRTTVSYAREFSGDILQEFGLKSHMVNTYLLYRSAAQKEGADMSKFDDHSSSDLFMSPFSAEYLEDPYVYLPILGVMLYTFGTLAFEAKDNSFTPVGRLDPTSNTLYAFNYGLWQPFGSGAPEEMFYRGFLQNEFRSWVDSPFFSIPLSTFLFAISHAPGNGRYTAAVAGGYLGYLADRYHGRLGPGIAVHFWGVVLLGIETIVESQRGQGITPPSGLSLQVDF